MGIVAGMTLDGELVGELEMLEFWAVVGSEFGDCFPGDEFELFETDQIGGDAAHETTELRHWRDEQLGVTEYSNSHPHD